MSDEQELNIGKVIDFSSRSALKQLLEEDTSDDIVEYGGAETRKLDEINKKHAFVASYYGKPMIMCYVYDPVIGRQTYEFISPESFMMRYINDTIVVPTRTGKSVTVIEVGKWWLRHPARRQYDTVIFDPKHLERDKYGVSVKGASLNLWEGFAVEIKKGSWKRTRKHIWKVLCNKDKIKFKYFIKWLAWTVQNPGLRAEVCVIFKGKKGAGKGFIATQLLQIFGKHGLAISNRKHLTGQFNEHLQAVSFLFADEAYYPGDKEVEGTLKALITEPFFLVEGKGKQARQALNCLHVMMATNNEWVIPADASERRFFINEVDNRYAKNELEDKNRIGYFKRLWAETNEGGREAMLYDLLRMKLGDWHPREDVPQTEELSRQQIYGLQRHEKAILAILEQGIMPGYTKSRQRCVKSTTLNDYLNTLEPGKNKIHPRMVADTMIKLGASIVRDGQKGNVFIIPTLSRMRVLWNTVYTKTEFPHPEMEWMLTGEAEF